MAASAFALGLSPDEFLAATPLYLQALADRQAMREAREWEKFRWLASVCATFSFSGKRVLPEQLLTIPLLDGAKPSAQPIEPLTDEELKAWLTKE